MPKNIKRTIEEELEKHTGLIDISFKAYEKGANFDKNALTNIYHFTKDIEVLEKYPNGNSTTITIPANSYVIASEIGKNLYVSEVFDEKTMLNNFNISSKDTLTKEWRDEKFLVNEDGSIDKVSFIDKNNRLCSYQILKGNFYKDLSDIDKNIYNTTILKYREKIFDKTPEITVKNFEELFSHSLESYEIAGKKEADGGTPIKFIASFDSNIKLETKYGDIKFEKNKYYQHNFYPSISTTYSEQFIYRVEKLKQSHPDTSRETLIKTSLEKLFAPLNFNENSIEEYLKEKENFIKETILNIDESKLDNSIHIDEEFKKDIKQEIINCGFSRKDSEELINKIRSINDYDCLREINGKIDDFNDDFKVYVSGVQKNFFKEKAEILEKIIDAKDYETFKNLKVEIEKYCENKEEALKEINLNKSLYHISTVKNPIDDNSDEAELKEVFVKEIEKTISEKDSKDEIKELEDLIDDIDIDDDVDNDGLPF
jgi:hypothetical protein